MLNESCLPRKVVCIFFVEILLVVHNVIGHFENVTESILCCFDFYLRIPLLMHVTFYNVVVILNTGLRIYEYDTLSVLKESN